MIEIKRSNRFSLYAAALTGIAFMLMHYLVLFGYKIPDMAFLAWVYLVPLLVINHTASFKKKFLFSFFSQVIGYWGLLYWLLSAMQQYGGLNIFQAFGVLMLLVMVLSFFKSVFIALTSWVNIYNRLPLAVLLPLFLCSHDLLLHYFPWGGLPWGMPAYSQVDWIRFFQWIDHTGTMGLNFYIYVVNGLVADALIQLVNKKQIDHLMSRLIIIFVLALLSFYFSFLSKQSFERHKKVKGHVDVALIQGNISQDQKWDFQRAKDNLNKHLTQTRIAVKNGASLVIWPETAYPYGIRVEDLPKERFLDQDKLPAVLFIGAVTHQGGDRHDKIMRNSILHIDTTAAYTNIYHKNHLVPFGEYLPMKDILPIDPLVHGIGEFTPGSAPVIFESNGIQYGNLICFEDVYPDISKDQTRLGAEVLINYTNDAWYGNTSAPYQHLAFSQFRALENRRPLLRSTNTGITAVIAPTGEILTEYPPFKEGYLFYGLSVENKDAFFTKTSNAYQFIIAALSGLIFAYTLLKRLTGPVKPQY